MPNKFILLECSIVVNGTDFSDHVSSVEIALSKKSVDTTNFSGGGSEQQQGLREDSFTVNFQQDFNAASVDSVLYPLYETGNEFVVVVLPVAGAASETNPSFTGTCILMAYTPLSGKPGALSEAKVKFPSQRSGIARATS